MRKHVTNEARVNNSWNASS